MSKKKEPGRGYTDAFTYVCADEFPYADLREANWVKHCMSSDNNFKCVSTPIDRGATRHDKGKPKIHLFHPAYLASINPKIKDDPMVKWFYDGKALDKSVNTQHVAAVLAKGAEKYGALNYAKGMLYSRVFDSYMRHAYLGFYYQEPVDEETGLNHDWHAAANVMFAQLYCLLGFDGGIWDDRPSAWPKEAV